MAAQVKIRLPLWSGNMNEECGIVTAELVDVPHLASVATFAVHRNLFRPGWRISNVETGCYVEWADARTRREALARFHAGVNGQTPARIRRAFAKWERLCKVKRAAIRRRSSSR